MTPPSSRARLTTGLIAASLGVALFAAPPASAINTVRTTGGANIDWQVNDGAMPGVDTGSIRQITGNALLSFGGLRVSVPGAGDRLDGELLRGFGLKFDGFDRFTTTTPVRIGGVDVARELTFNRSSNYARWFDSFTNRTSAPVVVEVAFGGILGQSSDWSSSYQDAQARVLDTSSGDRAVTSADEWVAVGTPQTDGSFTAPTRNGSSATVLGDIDPSAATALVRQGNFMRDPFTNATPASGHESNFQGYVRRLEIGPGQTKSLAHFVAVAPRDSSATPTNLSAVVGRATALAATPDFAGLSTAELCTLANWSLAELDASLPATCLTAQSPQPEAAPAEPKAVTTSPYDVVGKTVTELQADMRAGKTTSQEITRAYLDRIAAYDRGQRGLHSFIHVAEDAMEQAKKADEARAAGKDTDLLGIPVAVKDLYATKDMPTTNGSLVFEGFQPQNDAFQVAKMREAGAVILGKANMSEYANSGRHSESPWGQVWNAIKPSATSQGSSGGSGVSVAASLAAFSMGSQTGVSLNAPSGASSLVALRGTDGMSSGRGVMPLNWLQDYAGPMARSVSDLAAILNFTTGTDPQEEVTAPADQYRPADWKSVLDKDSLRGKKIGYVPELFATNAYGTRNALDVTNAALAELEAMGATLVPVSGAPSGPPNISTPGASTGSAGWWEWLDDHPEAPYSTAAEIMNSQKKLPYNRGNTSTVGRMTPEQIKAHRDRRTEYKARIKTWMDDAGVDFVLYPNNVSEFHDNDSLSLGGSFATAPSSNTGAPEVIVPIGKDANGYPVSVQLQGRAWDDAKLVGWAYAIEQRFNGHVEPTQFPALPYDASATPRKIEIPKAPAPITAVAPAPSTNLDPGSLGAVAPAVQFPSGVKLKGTRAKVVLTNTGAVQVRGRVVIKGKVKVKTGRKTRTVTRTFGTAKVTLKAGQRRTVSVRLNATGRKAVKGMKAKAVTLTYELATGTSTSTQSLKLRR